MAGIHNCKVQVAWLISDVRGPRGLKAVLGLPALPILRLFSTADFIHWNALSIWWPKCKETATVHLKILSDDRFTEKERTLHGAPSATNPFLNPGPLGPVTLARGVGITGPPCSSTMEHVIASRRGGGSLTIGSNEERTPPRTDVRYNCSQEHQNDMKKVLKKNDG